MNDCNCGCHTSSQCTCNLPICPVVTPGQISGELLGTTKLALIQNGVVIGSIPFAGGTGSIDLLDAFGDVIPES